MNDANEMNEGSVLSKLWRVIIKDLNLITKLDGLLINYDSRYKHVKGSTSTIKKKSLSALRNDAYGINMTWKAFVNLLFNVLNVKTFRIIIELEFRNNKKTSHEIKVIKNTSMKQVGEDNVEKKE